jgi:hypothetical protein
MACSEYRIYSDDPVNGSFAEVPPAMPRCVCIRGCLKPLCTIHALDFAKDMCFECRQGDCQCLCIGCDAERTRIDRKLMFNLSVVSSDVISRILSFIMRFSAYAIVGRVSRRWRTIVMSPYSWVDSHVDLSGYSVPTEFSFKAIGLFSQSSTVNVDFPCKVFGYRMCGTCTSVSIYLRSVWGVWDDMHRVENWHRSLEGTFLDPCSWIMLSKWPVASSISLALPPLTLFPRAVLLGWTSAICPLELEAVFASGGPDLPQRLAMTRRTTFLSIWPSTSASSNAHIGASWFFWEHGILNLPTPYLTLDLNSSSLILRRCTVSNNIIIQTEIGTDTVIPMSIDLSRFVDTRFFCMVGSVDVPPIVVELRDVLFD